MDAANLDRTSFDRSAADDLLPLLRRVLQLRQLLLIAFPAVAGDGPPFDAFADSAGGLGPVSAIGVAAVAQKRTKLREARVQLTRIDPPEAHLAEARRVHQI